MEKEHIRYLIRQHLRGALTASEQEELFQLTDPGRETPLLEVLQEMMEAEAPAAPGMEAADLQAALQQVLAVDKPLPATNNDTATLIPFNPAPRTARREWLRYVAAAAVILLLGVPLYRWLGNRSPQNPPIVKNSPSLQHDALPGRNGAILTLANGRKIVLDSLGNGVITTQGKTTIRVHNNQLVYDAPQAGSEMLYNTMTTPRGRQYELVLPDGSRVWLNAASSITYPAAFLGKDRTVTITGEAYFEVAKEAGKPFLVQVASGPGAKKGPEIEVLGTRFNIHAYSNERIKTTLLEGRVKVKEDRSEVLLRPGQQASVAVTASGVPDAGTEAIKVVNDADLDQVMAWKNGYFKFDNTDIQTVMRQLERWYDLDIVYEGAVPKDRFGGKLPRDAKASEVLKALEQTQVHFRIEGKKLIVMP